MELRSELAPIRKRFTEFQQIDDDPSRSISYAEKITDAIQADAKFREEVGAQHHRQHGGSVLLRSSRHRASAGTADQVERAQYIFEVRARDATDGDIMRLFESKLGLDFHS